MTYFPICTAVTSFVLECVEFQGEYLVLDARETTTVLSRLIMFAYIALYSSYVLFLDFYAHLGVF